MEVQRDVRILLNVKAVLFKTSICNICKTQEKNRRINTYNTTWNTNLPLISLSECNSSLCFTRRFSQNKDYIHCLYLLILILLYKSKEGGRGRMDVSSLCGKKTIWKLAVSKLGADSSPQGIIPPSALLLWISRASEKLEEHVAGERLEEQETTWWCLRDDAIFGRKDQRGTNLPLKHGFCDWYYQHATTNHDQEEPFQS